MDGNTKLSVTTFVDISQSAALPLRASAVLLCDDFSVTDGLMPDGDNSPAPSQHMTSFCVCV